MTIEVKTDRLLNHIIIYGFSLAFGAVIASLQSLRAVPRGFSLEFSWWTLVVFLLATASMIPCFHLIVYPKTRNLRRVALATVVLVGVAAFFYPLRVVPRDKIAPVLSGLAAAAAALAVIAALLLLLHRFFENDQKRAER